jgi:hypothetical protein
VAHVCAAHQIPAFGLSACYFELKVRARRGEKCSDEELAFVGMEPNGHEPTGGWHVPDGLDLYELDDGLSPEDSSMLTALMAIDSVDLNRERLDFLV